MKSYENRLLKLEKKTRQPFPDVLEMIAAGRCYSSLTDEERERYAEYRGFPRGVLEAVESAVFGGLDFELCRRGPVPTTEQLKQMIAEIETVVLNSI